VLLVAVAGCALRVGNGHESSDNTVQDGPSACARLGAEKEISFGQGTEAFAFAWEVDHYLVVYSDPSTGNGDIYAARITEDGSPIGSPTIVESTPAQSDLPSLLRVPSGYIVVWQEGTAGKGVVAHALSVDGAPVGQGVSIASTESNQSRPVLSHAPGGQVAVTWMDSFEGKGGVQVALLDPTTLHVSGPQRVAASDVDGWPWLAGDDRTLAMTWSDKATGPYDIHFAAIDPSSLTVSVPRSVRGPARNDALLPRMTRTSFGFFAAWEDQRGSDTQIYMALVDSSGNHLAGGLVEEPNSGEADWPNVAWTGHDAGVVYYQWRESRPQIYLSFIDGKGSRVGGLGDLRISGGSGGWSKYPDIVWTGTEFGVMYVDTRTGKPALWFQRASCPSPSP
jgi:hypothetical protein